MKKKFEVQIYFSGFCTYEIEAENIDFAIEKARLLEIKKNELFSNLENWKEADTAIEIKDEKVRS
jgi:hypothetical protein